MVSNSFSNFIHHSWTEVDTNRSTSIISHKFFKTNSWRDEKFQNGSWVNYSFSPVNADLGGSEFINFAYFVIAFSACILVHSLYINRLRISIVRIFTDIATIATILCATSYLQCAFETSNCTPIETVVYVDILANAVFGAVVQGCDNYITFARYAVVVGWRISKRRYILTLLWVIFGLYICWWPFFTLAPFVTSMNSDEAAILFYDFQIWWNFPAYTLYNLYHSYLLFIEIGSMRSNKTILINTVKAEVMAFKSILHDMVSIVGVGCYAFTYPLGTTLQTFLLVCALHFIFNWKLPTRLMENYMNRDGQVFPSTGDVDDLIFREDGDIAELKEPKKIISRKSSLDKLSDNFKFAQPEDESCKPIKSRQSSLEKLSASVGNFKFAQPEDESFKNNGVC